MSGKRWAREGQAREREADGVLRGPPLARRAGFARRWSLGRALVLSLAAVAAFTAGAGCGSVGDASYRPPTLVPLNQVDLNDKPYCVGSCLPDYGSTLVNCKVTQGLEFFPVDVMNGDTGTVTGFYSYTDNTADFLQAGPDAFPPNAIVTNDPSTTQISNYEPQTVQVSDGCAEDGTPGPNNVHHLRGGLFTEWGGGMGRRLQNFVSTAPSPCSSTGPAQPGDPDYCPDADPRIESVADLPGNESLRSQFYGMMADLSGWEGISFWARQGPNNTGGIRVYVGDRQLDDDIAFLERNAGLQPLCRRAKSCGCFNHKPCTKNSEGQPSGPQLVGQSCWDPALDPAPWSLRAQALASSQPFVNPYDVCGNYACDEINQSWQAVDPLFATPDNTTLKGSAACQPYKFKSDFEEYYCYDPENPASFPPEQSQRCGDGWEKGVTLSNDWQFFTVPFSELRQEGYGQRFAYLDLSKITVVRFTWTQGWVDVWLDDVRFYRHKGYVGPTKLQTP
jgi:hypothetical protein